MTTEYSGSFTGSGTPSFQPDQDGSLLGQLQGILEKDAKVLANNCILRDTVRLTFLRGRGLLI